MEFNDLANDPSMKEDLIILRICSRSMDERSNGRWTNSRGNNEKLGRKERSVHLQMGQGQEDFYDELLLISSTSNENILFKGLNHPNEAVRYWAGQGLYNLDKNIKKATIELLNQKLNDSVINVGISAARALLKHESHSKELMKVLSSGLKAENEWTRLQTALVLDDFQEALRDMESQAQKLIDKDPNKYVVRVLNHGLNNLNGTSNKVR